MSQFRHAAATAINWERKRFRFIPFRQDGRNRNLQMNGIVTERKVNTGQSKYPIHVERRRYVENVVLSMGDCIMRGFKVPILYFKLLFSQTKKDYILWHDA
jgi:hypothetical protein